MSESFEAVIALEKVWGSPSYGNVISLKDGRLMWAWGQGRAEPLPLMANFSDDMGRSWTDPQALRLGSGEDLLGVMDVNLMRLGSGSMGLVNRSRYEKGEFEAVHPAEISFSRSEDEGRTWSEPVCINRVGGREYLTNEVCAVLKDGRIIVPVYDYSGPRPAAGNPKIFKRYGEEFNTAARSTMSSCYAYYSDDEGRTRRRSRNEAFVVIEGGFGGNYAMGEPTVVELKDGRLLMLGRTNIGRFFQSYSDDRGETWNEPLPTELACPPSPATLKRIPETGDLLVIWNQLSRWEIMNGLFRHRLSCAISKDEGEHWELHRNLESLDDTTHVEPVGMETVPLGKPRQPLDRVRYHRAPGVLRYSYPSCTFVDGRAIITYGASVLGDPGVISKTYGLEMSEVAKRFGFAVNPANPEKFLGNNKIRVLPVSWFYESLKS